jgi:hypothetical protein
MPIFSMNCVGMSAQKTTRRLPWFPPGTSQFWLRTRRSGTSPVRDKLSRAPGGGTECPALFAMEARKPLINKGNLATLWSRTCKVRVTWKALRRPWALEWGE